MISHDTYEYWSMSLGYVLKLQLSLSRHDDHAECPTHSHFVQFVFLPSLVFVITTSHFNPTIDM